MPDRLLAAAWREFAERDGPACLLVARSGVFAVGWANLALSELLGVDGQHLVGRSLGELVDADTSPAAERLFPPPSPSSPPPPPSPGAGAAAGHAPAGHPGPPVPSARAAAAAPPPGWATVAHRLARSAGGSGMSRVRHPDGTWSRTVVHVHPVTPAVPSGPGSGSVADPGTVGMLPAAAEPEAWLVTLEPVGEAAEDLLAALTLAEHRFAALAGCTPIGIFASDAGLRLGYVNDRFVALTGVAAHGLLGTGWLDVIHRDDLPAVYSAVQTVLTGTPVELTARLARDDDQQCWLQLRLAPTTTPARAAGFIGTAEDVTQRRSWEEHLTYQARHDPLTGLVNRRYLIEVLADLLGSRRARDREFAVLFLDLDGFKEVNDTYGHDVGDRVLIEVARRMQRVVRDTDLLARVAGDEFVVVLRQITAESEAAAAARRHLAALAAPLRIGEAEIHLSASVGAAVPTGFDTPESLLRAADRVMYEAKAAGHGLYRLAPVSGEGR